MPTNVSIIGAGGHARVVIEAVQMNLDISIQVADENLPKQSFLLNQYPIDLLQDYCKLEHFFHVAIGNNKSREKVSSQAIAAGKSPFSIIHNNALISTKATLLEGVFVAANAIVASEAMIEAGCIINHAALIDHDCKLGAYSHIAPNATLGGGVTIGRQCLIGAGTIILPNIVIGDNVTIGAGSVVTKSITSGKTYVGNPAKQVS